MNSTWDTLMGIIGKNFGSEKHDGSANKSLQELLDEALQLYNVNEFGQAGKLFQFLAEKKNQSAIYHIGLMFQEGQGVDQNVEVANLCYQYVLSIGNFANAALELAFFHRDQSCWSAAWKYFVIADMQGSGVALRHLHDMRKSAGFVYPPHDSHEVAQLLLQAETHIKQGLQQKAENLFYAAAQLGSLKAVELLKKMRD